MRLGKFAAPVNKRKKGEKKIYIGKIYLLFLKKKETIQSFYLMKKSLNSRYPNCWIR